MLLDFRRRTHCKGPLSIDSGDLQRLFRDYLNIPIRLQYLRNLVYLFEILLFRHNRRTKARNRLLLRMHRSRLCCMGYNDLDIIRRSWCRYEWFMLLSFYGIIVFKLTQSPMHEVLSQYVSRSCLMSSNHLLSVFLRTISNILLRYVMTVIRSKDLTCRMVVV